MDLKKQVALITGGTKGIGFGIAKVLVEQGVSVFITSRSSKDVQVAVDRLNAIGADLADGVECDVRDENALALAFSKAKNKFGAVSIAVANAGVGKFASIESLSKSDWDQVIDINVTGVFNTTQAALPQLEESKGILITIASLAGTNFFKGGAAYNASKFAVVGFTQAVMLDVRDKGIRVSTIMPGSVTSHFNGHVPSEKDQWKIQPDDIGKLVLDLVTMPARTLPSKIEVRPSMPPKAK